MSVPDRLMVVLVCVRLATIPVERVLMLVVSVVPMRMGMGHGLVYVLVLGSAAPRRAAPSQTACSRRTAGPPQAREEPRRVSHGSRSSCG
jgi:hypothetical protein